MKKKFKSKFAKKSMLTGAYYPNSIWYKVDCECSSNECQLEIQFDNEYGDVTLYFYKDVYFNKYMNYSLFPNDGSLKEKIIFIFENIKNSFTTLFSRLKTAFKIIFTGHLKMSSDIIISGEEHINNLIEILKEGKKYVLDSKGEESENKN